MTTLNAQRLLREGKAVIARPHGLRQCENPDCGLHFRPTFEEAKFCSACVEAGDHLPTRRCAYKPCNALFKPKHASALYHSASCRQLAYAARKGAA